MRQATPPVQVSHIVEGPLYPELALGTASHGQWPLLGPSSSPSEIPYALLIPLALQTVYSL